MGTEQEFAGFAKGQHLGSVTPPVQRSLLTTTTSKMRPTARGLSHSGQYFRAGSS